MPAKNTVKTYIANSYYHIYNRGVDKRTIFQDKQDYKVLLSYLKTALLPPPDPKTLQKTVTVQGSSFKGIPRQPNNFCKSIQLTAYCLMPNHFHFLIRQVEIRSIEAFMRSVLTRYSKFFNQKYKRKGHLFEGIYKAVHVDEEPHLLHLTRYIHLNPIELTDDITKWYSSYAEYLKIRNTSWVKPDDILEFFEPGTLPMLRKHHTYKNFVENHKEDSKEFLGKLALE